MKSRRLGGGGLEVSSIGLGCMGMTPLYGTPDPNEAVRSIHAAIEAGITLFDTADAYNGGKNEELVGAAFKGYRDKVCIATKFGNVRLPDGSRTVNGRPEYVLEACDKSLQRLGIDVMDLYYVHRVDPSVPIEETVGAMASLVEAGKVRFIGLSEAGADTIRRAHATHPLAAVQTEYSLATRHVEEAILPACRELNIGFVAYSPLARGLVTGGIRSFDMLAENDRRRDMPRFQPGNLESNLVMVDKLAAIADEKEVSTAALALAWLLARGSDIVPIPGCSRRTTLADCVNALNLSLGLDDIARMEQAIQASEIIGTRYPEKQMARLGL
jgi:aryl-alcohol dehydrogenase-like predicted oxidoreductase